MENETKTIISPTLSGSDRTEVVPSVESGQGDGLISADGDGPIKSPKSDLPKKFGYFLGENALARLALKMDAPPERQQEILRQYAKGVVEAVFEGVKCPEATGVLLNLDFPIDRKAFKAQLKGLLLGVKNMGDLAKVGREDFELCINLIERIRNEVIRLVEQGLEEKGLERKVGVKGIKFGEGGFGKVFACRLGNGNVAAKLIKKEMAGNFTYHQYPELIEATKENEHLVRFSGSLKLEGKDSEHEESDRLDFFEELPGWVSLSDYWNLREGSERVRRDKIKDYLKIFFLPALSGLRTLHGHQLLHGDIKPGNILVSAHGDKPSVKLGDYDLVRRFGWAEGEHVTGSPAWMSPEQFQGEKMDDRTDIFSMGMMLYYALGGEEYENYFDQGKRVMSGLDVSQLDCPKPLRKLVESCLREDSKKRPTADELIRGIESLIEDPDFGIENEVRPIMKEQIQAEYRKAA